MAAATALVVVLAAACGDDGPLGDSRDGSFGTGVPSFPRDTGLDGGASSIDASVPAVANVSARFVHGFVNVGPLTVCHDPDGDGPAAAAPLAQDDQILRANFGERSPPLLLPALASGSLTLQREARSMPDAGSAMADAGSPPDPCSEDTREATIPLPIDGRWLDPSEPVGEDAIEELGLSTSLSGAPALTLLGSGLALNAGRLAEREAGERAALEAAFGPRVLIQADLPRPQASSFALSVFHALPDVAADGSDDEQQVGAVRLCITAGTREGSALPRPPAAGIPFRMRVAVAEALEPRLDYHFRVFAQRDFDAERKDCSTTNLMPIAELKLTRERSLLQAGHSYTLALLGAISPSALCSPNSSSIVRAGCMRPASDLSARIVVFED